MHSGITLDCTAHSAAQFALWLRSGVLSGGTAVMFNTEWGLESDLPSMPVSDVTRLCIAAAFVAHLVGTGNLD